MTIESQNISTDFYAGNTKRLRVTVVDENNAAKDLTDSEITFTLFHERTGQVYIRKSSVEMTEISIDNAVGGICTVYLLPPDTVALTGTYRYQINMVDVNGYEETVTTGRINIFASFARRHRTGSQSVYLRA